MTDRALPLHLVTARAGSRRIAIDAAAVARVLPLPSLVAPPSLPPAIRGLARVADKTAAVIDLLALLDAAEPVPPGLYAHLLLLREESAGAPAALLVDRVTGLAPTPPLTPVPAEASANGCVVGTFVDAGESVSLLAVDKLLLAAERERIAALCAALERRTQAAAE